jgi:hypothetical protein
MTNRRFVIAGDAGAGAGGGRGGARVGVGGTWATGHGSIDFSW